MNPTQQRRAALLEQLRHADTPVSASALAEKLGVSRQIIVGDVALLRAGGEAIEATPRGYRIARSEMGVSALLACRHDGLDQLRRELYIVADNGGVLEDVIVENPLYGQITGRLHITSRYDADQFLARAAAEQGRSLLCNLTGGVHLHTVRAADSAALQRISETLRAEDILFSSED